MNKSYAEIIVNPNPLFLPKYGSVIYIDDCHITAYSTLRCKIMESIVFWKLIYPNYVIFPYKVEVRPYLTNINWILTDIYGFDVVYCNTLKYTSFRDIVFDLVDGFLPSIIKWHGELRNTSSIEERTDRCIFENVITYNHKQ